MSQHAVGVVIKKLLADQDTLDLFVEDPLEALARLCLWAGVELTLGEIGAFVQADFAVWFSNRDLTAVRVH